MTSNRITLHRYRPHGAFPVKPKIRDRIPHRKPHKKRVLIIGFSPL
jgi:hypothetical protein